MPYDRNQLRLTWGGSLGGDGDIWQCGLHLAALTTGAVIDQPTDAEVQTLLEGPISDMHANAGSYICSGVVLEWAKVAHLDTSGAYVADESFHELGTPVAGADTNSRGAPQLAMAITLWSGSSFGQANYGRYYLPWNNAPVILTLGTLSDTEAGGMAAVQKTFLDAVNSWGATLDTDVFVSNLSPIGAGTTKRVTTVRVGSVKDTQQRRRNKLVERYASTALA